MFGLNLCLYYTLCVILQRTLCVIPLKALVRLVTLKDISGRYVLLFCTIEGKNIETAKYIFELYYTINNDWACMLVTFKRLSFS